MVDRYLKKYAQPEVDLGLSLEGERLTVTFDLSKELVPQFDEASGLALLNQRRLGFKLKRQSAPPTREKFEEDLRVLDKLADGKSLQQIGNELWPHRTRPDLTPSAQKSKVDRAIKRILKAHSKPRLKAVPPTR